MSMRSLKLYESNFWNLVHEPIFNRKFSALLTGHHRCRTASLPGEHLIHQKVPLLMTRLFGTSFIEFQQLFNGSDIDLNRNFRSKDHLISEDFYFSICVLEGHFLMRKSLLQLWVWSRDSRTRLTVKFMRVWCPHLTQNPTQIEGAAEANTWFQINCRSKI